MSDARTKSPGIIVILCLLGVTLTATGCFHQQVVTEKDPGSTMIENKWATSFIAGLVPPPVVETAQECRNGVARVETKISFLNGLVGAITFNIYTPMTVKVTCAAGEMAGGATGSDVTVEKNATREEVTSAIRSAVAASLETGEAATLRFN